MDLLLEGGGVLAGGREKHVAAGRHRLDIGKAEFLEMLLERVHFDDAAGRCSLRAGRRRSAALLLHEFGVHGVGLAGRDDDPLPVIAAEHVRAVDDLAYVEAHVREGAKERAFDGVRFRSDGDHRLALRIGETGESIEQGFPRGIHFALSSARVTRRSANSLSRSRPGFSPSLVRKCVKRLSRFPAMCQQIVATELPTAVREFELIVVQLVERFLGGRLT